MRICRICKLEKKESSFYKNKAYSDGLDTWCKICKSQYAKKYRENIPKKITDTKSGRSMLMTGIRKEDWCETYKLLLKIGYDPKGDIHKQFSEKYGLPYKKRPIRNKVLCEYSECLNTPNKTDSFSE